MVRDAAVQRTYLASQWQGGDCGPNGSLAEVGPGWQEQEDMIEIKAPNQYDHHAHPWLFLAGSTEMGIAENWQDCIVRELWAAQGTILNPRRDDWDSSWVQSKDSPQFFQQVTWELTALQQADEIAMYFDPATKSPITLLELGLFKCNPMLVCCPLGFWRKGNVDIVCDRYDVRQAETREEFIDLLIAAHKPIRG